jgi:hypothetical protein
MWEFVKGMNSWSLSPTKGNVESKLSWMKGAFKWKGKGALQFQAHTQSYSISEMARVPFNFKLIHNPIQHRLYIIH